MSTLFSPANRERRGPRCIILWLTGRTESALTFSAQDVDHESLCGLFWLSLFFLHWPHWSINLLPSVHMLKWSDAFAENMQSHICLEGTGDSCKSQLTWSGQLLVLTAVCGFFCRFSALFVIVHRGIGDAKWTGSIKLSPILAWLSPILWSIECTGKNSNLYPKRW